MNSQIKVLLFWFIGILISSTCFSQNQHAMPKPLVKIATIGSCDSGKTFLTCAILLVLNDAGFNNPFYNFDDLDDAPEERERGITIFPSVVEFQTNNVQYSLFDCPGHEDYLKTTYKCIKNVDGAILVVNVGDHKFNSYYHGNKWRDDTDKCIKMAHDAKVKKLVVFLNKCDLLNDEEQFLLNEENRILGELEKNGFSKKTPIIRGSALGAINGLPKWKETVDELIGACDRWFVAPQYPNPYGQQAIDLGLPSRTRWANMNVGATKPEEYGEHYAWGEIETKKEFNDVTYKYSNGEDTDEDGFYDDNCVLQDLGDICRSKYDVAYVKWGDEWQMPTKEQICELLDNCKIEHDVLNYVAGCRFIGPNRNSIFLPYAGGRFSSDLDHEDYSGFYWSGTKNQIDESYAYRLFFSRSSRSNSLKIWGNYYVRGFGFSVRPVSKKYK